MVDGDLLEGLRLFTKKGQHLRVCSLTVEHDPAIFRVPHYHLSGREGGRERVRERDCDGGLRTVNDTNWSTNRHPLSFVVEVENIEHPVLDLVMVSEINGTSFPCSPLHLDPCSPLHLGPYLAIFTLSHHFNGCRIRISFLMAKAAMKEKERERERGGGVMSE